jgi:hypothetical protein
LGQETARRERRSISSIVEDALRAARARRTFSEYREIQSFWSRKAREKGILTQRDLERYLRN